MNINEIVNYFELNINKDYAIFQSKLITTKALILGVKVGVIKSLAKSEIENADELINQISDNQYLELDYLKGLLISYQKLAVEEKLDKLEEFSSHIDNWAVCDTVVTSTRFKNKDLDFLFDWCLKMLKKEKTFEKRFGVIMLLKYFSKTNQLKIFDEIIKCEFGEYYFDMAVAWYFATALIYDFDTVLSLVIKIKEKSEFVYYKTIQKGIESYRISDEQKQILKNLRKR